MEGAWPPNSALVGALHDAIIVGERMCLEHPELDGPDPERRALGISFGAGPDPTRILHGVTLYRGLSPVYGWRDDELKLLVCLGQLAASLPFATREPVMVAAAARIWRLRSPQTKRRGGGGKNRART